MNLKNRKRVYYFGKTKSEGSKDMKELLGGKGANLAEMTSIGLPVPPGFTITTESCAEYNDRGGELPERLMDEVQSNMKMLQEETGKNFGCEENPLIVSVRSGAASSMPGMMDTVLNLGLNDEATAGLAKAFNNKRFALDAYRRLINMFGDVVMGVPHEEFEKEFDRIKSEFGVKLDTELDETGLEKLIEAYKEVYKNGTGEDFPQDPYQQLEKSIEAVFKSWNTPRAKRYREINEITGLLGTAVNIQTMVFGNMSGC
jgi:pyruvate,orthophosphate dikinase